MPEAAVALIGIGPRGLTLLERLISLKPDRLRLTVHVVDPGRSGEGVHVSDQPRALLTNTLASQVTIYPCERTPGVHGPSFTEWAQLAGYRRFGDDFERSPANAGAPIVEDDYLPRAMLGEYLADAYGRMAAHRPADATLVRHAAHARDIAETVDSRLDVHLDTGSTLSVDGVFLATGHSANRPSERDESMSRFVAQCRSGNARLGYFGSAYPVSRIDEIRADARVAIEGMGLTAYDVVATLTRGRGGRFEGDGFSKRYIASGAEPTLLIFSRSGLTFAARAFNQKGRDGRHAPQFFTRAKIERLRSDAARTRGDARLDFDFDVLPMLKLEMASAYRMASTNRPLPDGFAPSDAETAAIEDLWSPHSMRRDFAEFRDGAHGRLVADVREAERGNLTSPIKAACDVIRDCRDAICAAVEHRGLRPASHRRFVEIWTPTMNRIAFGPPRVRNFEWLALIEAGILDWAGGPGCSVAIDRIRSCFRLETEFSHGAASVDADVLIKARAPSYDPENDEQRLGSNLLLSGMGRPFRNGDYHPFGLDVDEDQHLVGLDGAPRTGLWVLGFPSEGARFYTHALPRPERISTQTMDAHRAVSDFYARFANSNATSPAGQRQSAEA